MKPQTPVTVADCETLETALRRLGAIGAPRAVPRRRLVGLCGWNDRRLRSVMAAAPGLGVALGSCEAGYYIVDRPEDLDLAIAELHSRIGELARRAGALERIRKSDEFNGRLF